MWQSKTQVKKGDTGEKIVKEYFDKLGYIVYQPVNEGAHWIDMICLKDKKKAIAVEVKTKARFNKWAAQGIDIKNYKEYLKFIDKINFEFWLIFVDDKNGDVHALNILNKNYFYPNKYLIAWRLEEMNYLFNIGEQNINKLSQYDTRNYKFLPIN
jgi:Holliday junction resolvase-like predicted endonuclease